MIPLPGAWRCQGRSLGDGAGGTASTSHIMESDATQAVPRAIVSNAVERGNVRDVHILSSAWPHEACAEGLLCP